MSRISSNISFLLIIISESFVVYLNTYSRYVCLNVRTSICRPSTPYNGQQPSTSTEEVVPTSASINESIMERIRKKVKEEEQTLELKIVKMEVEEGPREEDEAVKGILEEDEIKEEEEEDEQRMEIVVKNENGSPTEATTASPTGLSSIYFVIYNKILFKSTIIDLQTHLRNRSPPLPRRLPWWL